MKNITILVPETAVPSSVSDPQYMFLAVNEFFRSAGKKIPFNVQLAGNSRQIELHNGLFRIRTDVLFKDLEKTDLIIIPAISGDKNMAIEKNKDLASWVREQYKNGAEAASLCLGAFLLASTGLLKGKACSTHWLHASEFRTMFPEVMLVDDKVITDQNGIYSSGGASSYWSLLLYLVEKYTDRETAVMAAKFFLLDIAKNSQSPFIIFKGQKDHDDREVLKAQEYIEEKYQDRISVDEISERSGVARRSLERRFKKHTSNTIIEYIQRVKIEAAKKELESGQKTVNEVMYDVGYSDPKAFRDVFKKITCMSPVEYRNKYTKEAVF